MTQLLKDILQGDDRLKGLNAVLLWDKVVDHKIQKHTKALKLQRKVLYVTVESSTWASELSFFKKEMLEKLNEKAGYTAVRDIRFKVGGIKE